MKAIDVTAKQYELYIDGQWSPAANGGYSEDVRPLDGSTYARVAEGGVEDVAAAVAAAQAAQPEWAALTGPARAAYLYRAAATLETRMEEVAGVLVEEGGGWFGKAMFETGFTVNLLRSAAEDYKLVTGETFGSSEPDKLSMTLRQPLGVVAAIAPWNFPLLLATKKVAHALIAGNTVVLKPASDTPVSGLKIAEIFHDSGLPAGVLNVVPGKGSVAGEALLDHPAIKLVTFTGSTEVGRHIAERCGRNLKRVILELGGKDPVIVLADADLDYAVDAVCFGAFMHQGQICMSAERIIVEEPIAEEFSRKLAAKAATLKMGEVIGPIIHSGQLDLIDGQVKDAVLGGATVLCGGERNDPYYPATVLSGVTRDMRIFQEETFGPVAPIIAVKDVHEAVEVANDSVYGLSSGVITNDMQRALYVAERLESGMVHINDACVHDECNAPFGGVKGSGYGREGGKASMDALTEVKWVTFQKGQRHFPF